MKPEIHFTTEAQRAQSNDPSAPATALASPACGWSRLKENNPRVVVPGIWTNLGQSADKKSGLVFRAPCDLSRLKSFFRLFAANFLRPSFVYSASVLRSLGVAGCFVVSILALTAVLRAQTNTFPASGNVGIGTTSPGSILDVRKATTGGVTNFDFYNIEPTSGTVGQSARLRLAPWNGFVGTNLSPYIEGLIDTAGVAGLAFGTYSGGAAVEKMRITYKRNVGIGTTKSQWPLEINAFGARITNGNGNAAQFDLVETAGGRDWALCSWGSSAGGGSLPGKFSIYDNTADAHRFLIDT